jgi:hypothetical protein
MANWYFGENGMQQGPVTDAELEELIAAGRIVPTTLVWREGMATWQPLAGVRGHVQASPPAADPGWNLPLGYPSSGYPPYGVSVPTSGLAVASMICGLVGIFTCTFFSGIPAVICGHMALNQIANSPLPMAGREMAITGLISGYLAVVPIISGLAFLVIFFVSMSV